MSDEGEIYWVPTTVSAFGLYCNLDLLEENDQKVPETLPEWEAVCDILRTWELPLLLQTTIYP